MFSEADRDRARDWVLRLARDDARIVAGAIVGSLAHGAGDRWSDLDLAFAVADDASPLQVLDDWTAAIAATFDAVHLFDLPHRDSLYRVFLFPGSLQVDISCTPAARFGATTPRFRLLFGQAVEKAHNAEPSARELFGYAVHHALRARFSIARGRFWQAEYWVSSMRDYALSLACRRRGIPAIHARGFDDLPHDIRDGFRATLVTKLERDELMRALREVVDALLRESHDVAGVAAKIETALRDLLDDRD